MSNGTILIVEDEAVTGLDLKEYLTGLGYTVCGVVPTGELAIARAGQYKPDLVLMDIGLAGKLTGIEAAAEIRERYGTPVIFLTAHFEDSTTREAAATNPVGYLIKPIDEKTLSVTIRMALHRNAAGRGKSGESRSPKHDKNLVLLAKACTGVTLLLYTGEVNKSVIFQNFIAEGIAGHTPCAYAYYRTKLLPRFRKSIKSGEITTFELRGGTGTFNQYLDGLPQSAGISGANEKFLCIVDFSMAGTFDDLLLTKSKLVQAGNLAWDSFLGIIAVPMEGLDAQMLKWLSEGVNQLVVLSGEDNIITFSTPIKQNDQVHAISQEIFENVVKKSLEFIILSCLDRQVSGFAIIREIKEKFHVDIPIARVYSYLYELEENGVLSAEVIGRTKMYSPTRDGEKYIAGRQRDIAMAYRQVLGSRY